jgi:4-hydroxy-tetrahydrodipicolinate synthase
MRGLSPALLLPFDAELAIDEAAFRNHLRDVAATPACASPTASVLTHL